MRGLVRLDAHAIGHLRRVDVWPFFAEIYKK
jgi:hypothetical protein